MTSPTTMAAAHAFLHGEAQVALRHDWKAHDEARSRPATPSTIRPSITSSSSAPRTSSRRTPPSKTPTFL